LKDSTKLGARSLEFIAKYRSTDLPEENRLNGMLVIARDIGGTISWGQLFRILEKTDEILNATDDLIYSLGDALKKEIRIAKPVLYSIKFSSPGETQIKIDFGVADIIKIIFEKLQFLGLEKQRRKAEVRKLELENQKQELENKNFSLEILRNALNLKREIDDEAFLDGVINSLSKTLMKTLGVRNFPPGIFGEESPERGILRNRVIPPAAELIGGDDPDFTVKATTDETNDQD
jgi:hypothetical protein